jgi:hypothetical protein
MKKSLCIFNYFEKNEEYKENCLYFIQHGINLNSDYIFVVNGESSIIFPQNFIVLYRENAGFDFQAYTHVIDDLNKKGQLHQYDYFIFINSSVRGPYINKHKLDNWQKTFIDMIKGNVKLVGTTINILNGSNDCVNVFDEGLKIYENIGVKRPYTHVQSQMFVMDRECLFFLKDKIFNNKDIDDFMTVVINKEIMMSQYVLLNGWNIDCIASLYKGHDYRIIKKDINPTSQCGDSYYPNCYFGKTLRPKDVIFFKTNRSIKIVENFESKENNFDGFNVLTYTFCIIIIFYFLIPKSFVTCMLLLIISLVLLIQIISPSTQDKRESFDEAGNVEIVISRYEEDINWINEEPFSKFKIICYNKGSPIVDHHKIYKNCKVVKLPNVGRCDHTYLYHIITRYDSLSNVTVFLPASCMDSHKRDQTSKVMDAAIKTQNTVLIGNISDKNIRETFYDFQLDNWKATNEKNNAMNPESKLKPSNVRPYGKWYDTNLHHAEDVNIVCYYGIFAISKKHIVQNPVSYYQNLIEYVDDHSNPEAGHYLERSWGVIFYPYPKHCINPSSSS